MEKNTHALQQRLKNLKNIKPMLMSLRTISLSSWRLSLRKIEQLKQYEEELDNTSKSIGMPSDLQVSDVNSPACLLVLGSTRGLCGGFNRDLLAFFQTHADDSAAIPRVIVFGDKLAKLFSREQIHYDSVFRYPKITRLTFQYTMDWLIEHLGEQANSSCHVFFNAYQGSSHFLPSLRTLNFSSIATAQLEARSSDLYIDGDLQALADYLFRQQQLLSLHESFLSSQAAEHAFRFQIMENAISNTDRLIQELGIQVQVERQKKITSEMRELSISAGLLDR